MPRQDGRSNLEERKPVALSARRAQPHVLRSSPIPRGTCDDYPFDATARTDSLRASTQRLAARCSICRRQQLRRLRSGSGHGDQSGCLPCDRQRETAGSRRRSRQSRRRRERQARARQPALRRPVLRRSADPQAAVVPRHHHRRGWAAAGGVGDAAHAVCARTYWSVLYARAQLKVVDEGTIEKLSSSTETSGGVDHRRRRGDPNWSR